MRYVANGQGSLVDNLSGNAAYQSFRPAPLQRVVPLEFGHKEVLLLSDCSRKLGEIEGMVRYVPNAAMYLVMYVRKEALLSAQIEGTQCTFDDVLDPDNAPALSKDVADVVRYVAATEYAVERMKSLPLCMRLLRETHARLIEGTRGEAKQPGCVRASQNWIGPAASTIATASYVPPNVDDMAQALSDLERFINEAEGVDPVTKAALVHYQFETIHPFLDGNGLLGRLLITLSLMNDGVLSNAAFYPSYELKLNRAEYYRRLSAVREEGDYLGWVRFFARCMLDSATNAVDSMNRLVDLHERTSAQVRDRLARGASNGLKLLDVLEENPIVNIGFVSEKLGVSRTSAAKLVDSFLSMGILRQRDERRQRYREYLYEDYLGILRAGGEPL
jgi:Fic family protein